MTEHTTILDLFIPGAKNLSDGILLSGSENPYSPLAVIQKWIIDENIISHKSGFDFLFVEFAPWFDAWQGRQSLCQEVLLCAQKSFDSEDLKKILRKYATAISIVQENSLVLFLHPYFTGQIRGPSWGSISRSRIGCDGEMYASYEEADKILLQKWLRKIPGDFAEKEDIKLLGSTQANLNFNVERSLISLKKLEVETEDIKKLLSRIQSDQSVANKALLEEYQRIPFEVAKKDFALTLELHHRLVRRIFNLDSGECEGRFETLFIAAPLRMTFASESNDDNQVPASYRGGVWIFAGKREAIEQSTESALRNLLKLSLLSGMSSVEASASESLSKGIRRHAVRTAAVAIMSRNMSHNIGSHVLSGVTAESLNKAQSAAELVVQRHHLFRYLQERMDFLAEISTGGSYMSVSLRLTEIVSSFSEQQLLLKHITGIKTDTGSDIVANVSVSSGKEFFVLSPGGRNGCHALYVIFENLIRNSAKHRPVEQRNDSVDLKIAASVVSDRSDLLRVRIWDMASNAGDAYKENRDKEVWQHINSVVGEESIINDDGTLKKGNWGIREIMIAAAYLRGIPIEDLEVSMPGPPLLKALVVNHAGENGSITDGSHLCYEFFLNRPRTALIIDEAVSSDLNIDKALFHNSGIDIISVIPTDPGRCADYKYLATNSQAVMGPQWPTQLIHIDDALRAAVDGAKADLIWPLTAKAWSKVVQRRHKKENVRLYKGDAGNEGCASDNAWEICSENMLSNAVIYDRHHHIDAEKRLKIDRCLFWESYEGGDAQKVLFEDPPESIKPALAQEFLTAGLARVVVLDERVQEAIETHQGSWGVHMTMTEAVERRRIYVPQRKLCGLKSVPVWSSINCYLDEIRITGAVDFIVVHLGILERVVMRRDDSDVAMGWKVALTELKSWSSQIGAELVICSGRGPKEVLDADIRFVPASSIERFVVHNPSKYHLYQLLSASRSPRHAQVRDIY
jgi:hypothetical protein